MQPPAPAAAGPAPQQGAQEEKPSHSAVTGSLQGLLGYDGDD